MNKIPKRDDLGPSAAESAAQTTVPSLLEAACRRYADHIAVRCGEEAISYRELADLSDRLGSFLRSHLRTEPGRRIAIMLPNIAAYPVLLLGIWKAGAVAVNVNPQYTARELVHQLRDSGTTVLFVSDSQQSLAESIRNDVGLQTIVTVRTDRMATPGDDPGLDPGHLHRLVLEQALSAPAGRSTNEVARDDIALLQYTGGTTGVSKGAVLTHRNLVSNIAQFRQVTEAVVKDGEAVVLTILPLYHIFALMVNALCTLSRGGTMLLVPNPKDLAGVVSLWRQQPVTFMTGVNTLFNGLLSTRGFEQLDFAQLRLTIGGGTAIQPTVARRWQQVTGNVLTEGYGLSETSPMLTMNPVLSTEFKGSIGLPVIGTTISIRDEHGHEVATGEVGELCAAGPQVTRGYWNRPDDRASAFTADGLFRTGDIARRDADGFLYLVDRKKDMILVSGFNVYPNEIEATCMELAGVHEVACIGVPDARTGEAVKVVIVRSNSQLEAEAVIAHCRQHLTAYKIPRHVDFVPALPKSPVGKILRRELRQNA